MFHLFSIYPLDNLFYADLNLMKMLLLLLTTTLLFGEKIYETRVSNANKKAMENERVKCRWVCDKKIYKEQKIAQAISFYKNSKYYKFTKN